MAINSELQFVAYEIAEFVGEPKKVGFWIGIVKRIGKSRAYEIMSTMKDFDRREGSKIKSRAAYFLGLAKK